MAKTLASYLADEPEAKLELMLENIRQRREELADEDSGLQVEERLVENALARKARRTGTRGGGQVTRDEVFEIVAAAVPRHFKPAAAIKAMRAAGFDLSDEGVRVHLRRLTDDRKFSKNGDFYFNPRASENGGGSEGAA